jgi:hypothetical protein
MKVPLKNRAMSVVLGVPSEYTRPEEIKVFEYAHEEPLLGEIAGHVFNRYLRFRKQQSPFGTEYDFRFGSTNPTKAILELRHVVDRHDATQSLGRIEEAVYENACEEFLYKAFEAIDKVHQLDNNFFDRIKYVLQRK